MSSRTGIFAESKQQGLEAFRKWSATLPIHNRPELCTPVESLPPRPEETVYSPLKIGLKPDFRKKKDDLIIWMQSRQRDGYYPLLDRLTRKKAKVNYYGKSTPTRHSQLNSSTLIQK
ncbi:hypothetical protein BgiMline_004864 [Biomphalaria glabrata]|uniref:Uncharacterized protein n=1 Tax=Biomphalaria glabrata TaxID=6526 RepID=A0A2C9KE71_BIOGL|nr:hypothetical protein BgiMline_002965 [Biomphalaria glabrata]KAI8797269.1 hypothetical protein BgiBS90_002446 [Biomphalaria glabrata]